MITHETKEPLHLSLMYLEQIIQDGKIQEEIAKPVKSSLEIALAGLNNFLAIKRSSVLYEMFDVIQLISMQINIYKSYLKQNNIQLDVKSNMQRIIIYSDKTIMLQILNNLIGYRTKLLKKINKSVKKIDIKIQTKSNFVVISICDTFEGQYQPHSLSFEMSRTMANMIGGKLEMVSSSKQGNIINFTIPTEGHEKPED